MKERSKIVKNNAIASIAIKTVSIGVSLLLVPLTISYVSSELYGTWLTLSSIVLWLNFFDIGFSLSLKNRLAEALAENDFKQGKKLVSTTYGIMMLLFLPLMAIIELLIPFLPWSKFLNVSEIYNSDICLAMHILVASFCFQMIVNVLSSVAAAFQEVALSNIFPVIGNALSLFVIYVLTKTCPSSLFVLSLALAIIPVLVYFISSFYLYSSKFEKVKPDLSLFDKSLIRDLFGLGAKFFVIQVAMVVLFQSTNILIANLSSQNDVTQFNIAYKYLNVAMMVFNLVIAPIWPAMTDAYAKNDYTWMKSTYRKMNQMFILCSVLLLAMVLVSPFVYKIWIGDNVKMPFMMSVLVGLFVFFNNWGSVSVYVVNGVGAVKIQSLSSFLITIIHIPLSIFLGSILGSYGVLLSLIILLIFVLILFTVQAHKILNQTATGIWAQ